MKFKLNKVTYAPSIYGESKFEFKKEENVEISNEKDEYFKSYQ